MLVVVARREEADEKRRKRRERGRDALARLRGEVEECVMGGGGGGGGRARESLKYAGDVDETRRMTSNRANARV
jgi:hypothetical protein